MSLFFDGNKEMQSSMLENDVIWDVGDLMASILTRWAFSACPPSSSCRRHRHCCQTVRVMRHISRLLVNLGKRYFNGLSAKWKNICENPQRRASQELCLGHRVFTTQVKNPSIFSTNITAGIFCTVPFPLSCGYVLFQCNGGNVE